MKEYEKNKILFPNREEAVSQIVILNIIPLYQAIFYSNKILNVYPLHVLRNFNYSDFPFYIIINKHKLDSGCNVWKIEKDNSQNCDLSFHLIPLNDGSRSTMLSYCEFVCVYCFLTFNIFQPLHFHHVYTIYPSHNHFIGILILKFSLNLMNCWVCFQYHF